MDEESYSDAAIDVKPINKNCNPNTKTVIKDDGVGAQNNKTIDNNTNKANTDATYDHNNEVKP